MKSDLRGLGRLGVGAAVVMGVLLGPNPAEAQRGPSEKPDIKSDSDIEELVAKAVETCGDLKGGEKSMCVKHADTYEKALKDCSEVTKAARKRCFAAAGARFDRSLQPQSGPVKVSGAVSDRTAPDAGASDAGEADARSAAAPSVQHPVGLSPQQADDRLGQKAAAPAQKAPGPTSQKPGKAAAPEPVQEDGPSSLLAVFALILATLALAGVVFAMTKLAGLSREVMAAPTSGEADQLKLRIKRLESEVGAPRLPTPESTLQASVRQEPAAPPPPAIDLDSLRADVNAWSDKILRSFNADMIDIRGAADGPMGRALRTFELLRKHRVLPGSLLDHRGKLLGGHTREIMAGAPAPPQLRTVDSLSDALKAAGRLGAYEAAASVYAKRYRAVLEGGFAPGRLALLDFLGEVFPAIDPAGGADSDLLAQLVQLAAAGGLEIIYPTPGTPYSAQEHMQDGVVRGTNLRENEIVAVTEFGFYADGAVARRARVKVAM